MRSLYVRDARRQRLKAGREDRRSAVSCDRDEHQRAQGGALHAQAQAGRGQRQDPGGRIRRDTVRVGPIDGPALRGPLWSDA